MNPIRGLVVISPTLKDNKARSLNHGFGQRARSPFSLELWTFDTKGLWGQRRPWMCINSRCSFRWSPQGSIWLKFSVEQGRNPVTFSCVAWPKLLVVLQSMSKTKQSRRKLVIRIDGLFFNYVNFQYLIRFWLVLLVAYACQIARFLELLPFGPVFHGPGTVLKL